ncbi:hypothetical protein D3C80_2009890 [compost metagenome]
MSAPSMKSGEASVRNCQLLTPVFLKTFFQLGKRMGGRSISRDEDLPGTTLSRMVPTATRTANMVPP